MTFLSIERQRLNVKFRDPNIVEQKCNIRIRKKIICFKMSLGLSFLLLDMAEREDKRRKRIRRNKLRRAKWDAFEMPERDFIKTFRLSKDLVKNLICELSPLIRRERRRDALSVKDKVLVALAFFASGSYQTLVGQSVYNGVSQPTVSRAVRQVTKALNSPRIFHKHVVFPTNREDRDKIKRSFYDKYKMPGVVGCVDGTHIAILKPTQHEERYINRKGYHSLNTMIICDLDLNILCVDPSHPGSTHDSRVWGNHPLHPYITETYNNGETMFFLGDSGYPLRKTMMTPFLNAVEGSPEAHYYNMQVAARNVVERCIGILKARFRCLLVARKLHYDPIVSGQIVNACAVLHNLANRARIIAPELSPEEQMEEREHQMQYSVAEANLRNEANNIDVREQHRVNVELQQGRMAQQALIRRLWMELNHH